MDPNSDRARAEHFTCAPRVVVLQGALELYPPAAKQNTCDAESVGAKTIVIAICMPIAKHVPQASSTTMDKLATFTLDEYECCSQRSSLFMCGQVNGWCTSERPQGRARADNDFYRRRNDFYRRRNFLHRYHGQD